MKYQHERTLCCVIEPDGKNGLRVTYAQKPGKAGAREPLGQVIWRADAPALSLPRHIWWAQQGCPGAQVLLLIPREKVLVRFFTFPSDDAAEIQAMVALQLQPHIPYALDEVVYQCQMIGTEKNGDSHVAVFILPRAVYEPYREQCQRAGIMPDMVSVSSFAVASAFMTVPAFQESAQGENSVCVFSTGDAVEVCFLCGGVLIFSRRIVFPDPEDAHRRLCAEIETTVHFYIENAIGPQPRKVMVIYDDAQAVEPLRQWAVDRSVSLVMLSISEIQPLLPESPERCVPAAVLSSPHFTGVSVTPRECVVGKKMRVRRFHMALTGMAIVAFAMIMGISTHIRCVQARHQWALVTNELASQQAQVRAAQKYINQIDALKKEFSGRIFVPDVIAALVQATPEGVSYRSIALTLSGALELAGYAPTSESVTRLQQQLSSSPSFTGVALTVTATQRIFDQNVVDFSMSAIVVREGEKR